MPIIIALLVIIVLLLLFGPIGGWIIGLAAAIGITIAGATILIGLGLFGAGCVLLALLWCIWWLFDPDGATADMPKKKIDPADYDPLGLAKPKAPPAARPSRRADNWEIKKALDEAAQRGKEHAIHYQPPRPVIPHPKLEHEQRTSASAAKAAEPR